jgi:hypothetical protein
MKKDFLLSLAAIEAAPQRSVGIADSAVQMFIRDLLLMLQKRNSHVWWGHQPLKKNKKPQPSKNENCGFKKLLIINSKLLIKPQA